MVLKKVRLNKIKFVFFAYILGQRK